MSQPKLPHNGRNLDPLKPFFGDRARPVVLRGGKAFSIPFRRALLAAHGEMCAYCGEALSDDTMRVDHVVPEFFGGKSEVENLAAACVACNSGKRERDLESFRWILAVRNSPIAGIVTPKQARLLQDAGVALPIHHFKFTFEEYIEAMA